MNLNYYFLTSALKTSFWASLKKFDFLAISWFSQYLGEAALKLQIPKLQYQIKAYGAGYKLYQKFVKLNQLWTFSQIH